MLSTLKRIPMKKRTAIATLMVAAVAAVGYAYWTANGTGSGTATVGTDSGVTISNMSFGGTLYPDVSRSVSFRVNNTSSNTKVKVGTVVADTSFGSGTGITGLPVGCDPTWFTFTPGTAINAEINPSSFATVNDASLELNDTNTNQDACKNASPVLHLKTDNSGL